MILTDENGNKYEFEPSGRFAGNELGNLKPLKKEWPQENDLYWYIDDNGEIQFGNWQERQIHLKGKNFGNIFRTKEQAEAAAKAVKELFRVIREKTYIDVPSPDETILSLLLRIDEAQQLMEEKHDLL